MFKLKDNSFVSVEKEIRNLKSQHQKEVNKIRKDLQENKELFGKRKDGYIKCLKEENQKLKKYCVDCFWKSRAHELKKELSDLKSFELSEIIDLKKKLKEKKK